MHTAANSLQGVRVCRAPLGRGVSARPGRTLCRRWRLALLLLFL